MDFVYMGDIARANLLAAASRTSPTSSSTSPAATETSLLELAEMLLRVMGSDLAVEHGPERAVNGVTRRLADTSRARDELGFEAEVDLEEGLHAPRRVVARRARRRADRSRSRALARSA